MLLALRFQGFGFFLARGLGGSELRALDFRIRESSVKGLRCLELFLYPFFVPGELASKVRRDVNRALAWNFRLQVHSGFRSLSFRV